MSIMSDKIGLDVDIINIRFKYLNTDTESDVEYSNSNTTPLNEFGLEYGRKISVPFSSLHRSSPKHVIGIDGYFNSVPYYHVARYVGVDTPLGLV